jgi:hypothetical protein
MYPQLAFLRAPLASNFPERNNEAVWLINQLHRMTVFEIREFRKNLQDPRSIRDFTLEAEALLGNIVDRIVAKHMEYENRRYTSPRKIGSSAMRV